MTTTALRPPHKANDRSKLASLIRALRRGDQIAPVVVLGTDGITGSHRIAAGERTGLEIPTIECSDLDYRRAAYAAGLETHDENLNLFALSLYTVTEDADLKAALADQGDGCDAIDADLLAEAMEMDLDQLIEARGW